MQIHKSPHHHDASALWLDRVGVALSGLCAIHCVLTPLLLATLPWLHSLEHDSRFHWVMALILVPVGVGAFWRGYRHHRDRLVLALGLAGMTLITLGLLGAGDFFTLPGSAFLIWAHWRNMRLGKCQVCSASSTRSRPRSLAR